MVLFAESFDFFESFSLPPVPSQKKGATANLLLFNS